MRIIWTKTAVGDVARVYDYLFDFNPHAAMRVVEVLRDEANSLMNLPDRGRPVLGTGMRELVASYPYVIRYRVVGDTLTILRIRHASRRATKP
jgi:addiction module RelE/StbE family toxin